MSQGPLIPPPEMVSTTRPSLSSTIRQPAPAVGDNPFVVGRFPTITQPRRKTVSAVVRPTPPGHWPARAVGSISAKRATFPFGLTCTMVVPVPCRLLALLKLLIRTSPLLSEPTDW